MKNLLITLLLSFAVLSCSTRKQIEYMQDIDKYNNKTFNNQLYTIQPNDILRIEIQTPDYKSAESPYSEKSNASFGFSIEALKLEGLPVAPNYIIKHRYLGDINVKDKTVLDLETELKNLIIAKNILKQPTVKVRIINAKYTIHGEVRKPGTYNMVDQRINILQALGTAGDLTINGVRDDIVIYRQHNGKQIVGRIDLTSASFIESPFYYIKQNDYIYVKPNGPQTKRAGYLTNVGSVLTAVSVLLSTYLIVRANF